MRSWHRLRKFNEVFFQFSFIWYLMFLHHRDLCSSVLLTMWLAVSKQISRIQILCSVTGNGVLMGRVLETALALLLTATYITTGFVTASKLWQSNQETQSPEKNARSVSRSPRVGNSFNNIFYPQKCDSNDRNLKACTLEDEMNETACLMIDCCFKDRIQNSCFHKTIDRPLQVLIILGIGILIVFVVVFCPFLCCLAAQRTKINSLLRKNKDVEEAKLKDMKVGAYVFSLLKKQKKRQKLTKGKKQSSFSEDP